jgi:hypothetical protein
MIRTWRSGGGPLMHHNRHARRRAAAQARQLVSHGTAQAPRRTGYVRRLVAAIDRGGLPRGVHSVSCVHSACCNLCHGGANCTCVPEISISGPDGVTEIDEAGNPRRHTRQ